MFKWYFFSSYLCIMHIKVVFISAHCFVYSGVTKEMLYCCCSIIATCCQKENLHSHSARLLFLFWSGMYSFTKLKSNFEIIQSNLEKTAHAACMQDLFWTVIKMQWLPLILNEMGTSKHLVCYLKRFILFVWFKFHKEMFSFCLRNNERTSFHL